MTGRRGPAHVDVPLDGADPVTLTVHGLAREPWAALIHEHPTSDPRWRYDADTLHPELLRRCVTDPVLSPELARHLVDDPDVGGDLVDLCLRLTEPGSLEWARRRLDTDARLADEVALCVRMGISHAAFSAWPETSQDLALAHAELQGAACAGCGVSEKEMGDPFAWEVDGKNCWWCGELHEARKQVPDEAQHRTHFRLIRPRPPGDDQGPGDG